MTDKGNAGLREVGSGEPGPAVTGEDAKSLTANKKNLTAKSVAANSPGEMEPDREESDHEMPGHVAPTDSALADADGVMIRAARPEEAAAIGLLAERAYDADGLLDADADYRAEVADGAARLAQGEVLVAEADGMLVGSIVLLRESVKLADIAREGEVELRLLSVEPGWRRRGIGQSLMSAAIERARAAGATGVVLCTADHMHAHAMYDRLGFERVPDRDWLVSIGWLRTYRLPL